MHYWCKLAAMLFRFALQRIIETSDLALGSSGDERIREQSDTKYKV